MLGMNRCRYTLTKTIHAIFRHNAGPPRRCLSREHDVSGLRLSSSSPFAVRMGARAVRSLQVQPTVSHRSCWNDPVWTRIYCRCSLMFTVD